MHFRKSFSLVQIKLTGFKKIFLGSFEYYDNRATIIDCGQIIYSQIYFRLEELGT